METTDKLLTIKDMCSVLRIGTTKGYSLIEQGILPHIRIDRKILIKESDLYAYIDSSLYKLK